MNLDVLPALDEMEARARSIAAAGSAAEVFKTLLDSASLTAPRAAAFLIRQGSLKGWGSVGYSQQVARAQRDYTAPVSAGWPGLLVARPDLGLDLRRESPADPAFGQPAPAEAAALLVRLKGKPVALVVLERDAGGSPWHPQVMGMLVTVAQLRLDLDLVQRKLAALGAGESAEKTAAPTAVAPAARPVATPRTDASHPPQLEAARRYARLVATDIRLYNEEAVILGRRNGDLTERLTEHLARGKETFLRRHGTLGPTGLQILHEAYVGVLAAGDASLIPASAVE